MKWNAEEKLKALSIADVITCAEAAKQTGIPEGTIKRWRMETRSSEPNEPNEPNGSEPNRTERAHAPKRIRELTDAAVERATEVVTQAVISQSEELANRILNMVRLAIEKSELALNTGPTENEPMAGWLKATVGAMHMGIDKAQLLTGKPTERQELRGEVKETHEQNVTHTHIHTLEEYREAFANAWARDHQLRSTASDDGAGQPVYTAETDTETS